LILNDVIERPSEYVIGVRKLMTQEERTTVLEVRLFPVVFDEQMPYAVSVRLRKKRRNIYYCFDFDLIRF